MAFSVKLVVPSGGPLGAFVNGNTYSADAQGVVVVTNIGDVVPLLNAGYTYLSGEGTGNSNLAATTDPGPTNDSTQDYAAGSLWINATANRAWQCVSAGVGVAVWICISVPGLPTADKNTNITTVGAGTLTAASIAGGLITRSGSTAAYTDTTDTAALIIAAVPNARVGQSWSLTIKNTVPFTQTIAGGTGVTLSGQTIIPPNCAGRFLITYSAAGAVTIQGTTIMTLTVAALQVVTNIVTVGAGTLTAAAIAGSIVTRGGAQSSTPFTDTTDTAANIIAAQPNANIGQSWLITIQNNTNAAETITGGTGVTVSGVTIIPANSYGDFLVTYTAAATVTIVGYAMGPNAALPAAQFVTISAGNGTLAAGNMEGSSQCFLASSGATAMTTRTAAQLIANIPNAQIGMSYFLSIFNSNGGTLTLTGGSSVTITGTATIATNIVRNYVVTITGASTVTMQNVGAGVAS